MKALMYHYVREPDAEMPNLRFLHIDNFRKQLDYIEREFSFVARDGFDAIFKNGRNILPSGVLLTFDDGLKDHFRYVLPELLKRKLWGFFFVPTGHYKTGKLLGVHRIHYLLSRLAAETLLKDLEEILKPEMFLHAEEQKFKSITYLRQQNSDSVTLVKKLLNYYIRYECRDHVLDQLMSKYCFDESELHSKFYLSKNEIRELQAAGMIVGSHTETHRLMSKISVEEQEAEITKSFQFLNEVTGNLGSRSFCYPYGGYHSFTAETENILCKQNVVYSFNVDPRDISLEDFRNRPHALPRYDCNQFLFGQAS